MTVYVDTAAIPATVRNGAITHTSRWYHLTATTKEELHAFAVGKLGLRRSYFQDKPNGLWHYDLTEGKRQQALRLGAVEIGYGTDSFETVWHAPGREGVRAPEPTGAATTDASSGPVEVPAPVPEPAPPLTTVIHVRDSVHGKDGGDNEVYIGRPSQWGNPFVIPRDGDRAQVIAAYRDYLHGNPGLMAQLGELRGKTLVCYCAPQPCHGDVLAALVNPVKVDQAWRDGLTSHQIRDVIVNLASSEVQHWCVDHARNQKETADHVPVPAAERAQAAAEPGGGRREGQDRPRGVRVRQAAPRGQTGELPTGDRDRPQDDGAGATSPTALGARVNFKRLGERRRLLVVNGFEGYHEHLSNFYHWRDWDGACEYDGERYRTAEHAFAAAKTLDPAERAEIAEIGSASKAKAYGRGVRLRPDWDERVRFEAMAEILASKFSSPERGLGSLLVQTEDDLLVERTSHKSADGGRRYWHDQTWGDCDCPQHRSWPGKNHLGRMLMARRAELRGEVDGIAPAERWVRVMCTGHRAEALDVASIEWVTTELGRVAAKLRREHGMRVAIHGGATGADLLWAQAAHHESVENIWAYLPFLQQADNFAPRWREMWEMYSFAKDDVVFTGGLADRSGALGDGYDVRLLHARNEWMVRDSDAVIAVIDPERVYDDDGQLVRRGSGTASALRQIGTSLPVITLDVRNRTVKIRRPGPADDPTA